MMKRLVALLLAIGMIMLTTIPVLAIADPDTPPAVNAVYVYEDLLQTGDIGVFIQYFLDYAALPDETATEAYLTVFIDTDGTTQLDSVAPYAYDDKGYGHGATWIYFSPSDVTSYGLDDANEALYRIWLVGNPLLSWVGDPPKTIGLISDWYTTGDPAILLAQRVLSYAQTLESAWSPLDLIEATAQGNRLTATGEAYFTNVIPNLRNMAPTVFSASTSDPTAVPLDYTTLFGATMTNGTGTVAGSPITLAEGSNTVNVTGIGTFILELEQGTTGTMTNITGTVDGSPVDLQPGTNTVNVTVIGTFDVDVNLTDTQAGIIGGVTGTAFDLTDAATEFGMSRAFFSGLVWMGITMAIMVITYRSSGQQATKASMLMFNICIIGGGVLGLLPVLVAILMFIGSGALTAYVLFFRGAYI